MPTTTLSIAFVTFSKHPDLTADDAILARYLEAKGHTVQPVPWDAPGSAQQLAQHDVAVLRSTWNYTDYFEKFRVWLKQLEAHSVRLLNDLDTVRWNSDKIYLRGLKDKGHPIVDTVWLERGQTALLSHLMSELGSGRAVIKPRVSATAKGLFTTTVETAAEDQPKLDCLLATHNAMLQPFVSEIVDHGEWSLVFFGSQFSHALIKRAKAGDHRVQSNFGGTASAAPPSPTLVQDAQRLIEEMTGRFGHPPLYSRVDGIERRGRLILMELELIEPDLFFKTAGERGPRLFEQALRSLMQD